MGTDDWVVCSSEEDVLPIGDPPGPAKAFWYDAKLQTVVRHEAGVPGQLEVAVADTGPKGFLLATFAGEKPFQTEAPNALLLPVLKKPKMAIRAKPRLKPKARPRLKLQARLSLKLRPKPPV